MFTVTPAAAEQVRQAARQGGTEGFALRLAAQKNADGSIDYRMGFDDATEDDILVKCEGIELVMAPEYVPLLDQARMDYVEIEPGKFHFIFLNPRDANYRPPNES